MAAGPQTGKGSSSLAAFRIETGEYGIPISCGAGNQIFFTNDGININMSTKSADESFVFGASNILHNSVRNFTGTITTEARYGDIAMLICALGSSHKDLSPRSLGSGDYMHYAEPDFDVSDRAVSVFDKTAPAGTYIRRGTLAIEKTVSIWQYESVMINGFSFTSKKNRTEFVFDVLPRNLVFDGAENNTTSSWTLPAGGEVLWTDLIVYIRPRDIFILSGNTLTITDSGGTATLSLQSDTYTGGGLAREIQRAANASATLNGRYTVEYDYQSRRFHLKCDIDFIVDITGTGSIADKIGFTTTTASLREHFSQKDALPSAFSAFSTSDQFNVTQISCNFSHNLNINADAESGLYITQPYGSRRSVRGAIDRARFTENDFFNAANMGDVYEMLWVYTGEMMGATNEKLSFYFPQVKFSPVSGGVRNAGVIPAKIQFTAQTPTDFCDVINFFDPDYHIRDFLAAPNGFDILAVGTHKDGLYAGQKRDGSDVANLLRLDGNSWTVVGSTNGADIKSLKYYNGKLYVGTTGGNILVWDGTTLAVSATGLGGDIVDLESFNDKLYAIGSDGKVHEFDGSTWVLSFSSATQGWRLKSFGTNLYAVVLETTGKIYRFTGSSWILSKDSGVTASIMSIEVHRDILYFSSNNKIFDGRSGWRESTASVNVRHLVSWLGNLFYIGDGASGDLYIFDVSTLTNQIIDSGFNQDAQGAPLIYQERALIPVASASMKYLEPPKELMLKITNQISTNPL